jgi:hypothetical protein
MDTVHPFGSKGRFGSVGIGFRWRRKNQIVIPDIDDSSVPEDELVVRRVKIAGALGDDSISRIPTLKPEEGEHHAGANLADEVSSRDQAVIDLSEHLTLHAGEGTESNQDNCDCDSRGRDECNAFANGHGVSRNT